MRYVAFVSCMSLLANAGAVSHGRFSLRRFFLPHQTAADDRTVCCIVNFQNVVVRIVPIDLPLQNRWKVLSMPFTDFKPRKRLANADSTNTFEIVYDVGEPRPKRQKQNDD
jgi:hypothetical protein